MTSGTTIKPKAHLTELYRGVATAHSRTGYLRLDLNESVDNLPASFVRDVLDKVTPELLGMYPEYDALIAEYTASVGLPPDRALPSNGSDGAIKWLFEAFIAQGDTVLYTDPTFAMYAVYCSIYQAIGVAVPYESLELFPYEPFLARIREGGVRMAVVVNPNNPTGSSLDQDKIRILAECCAEHGTILVVDEAYFHYLGESAMPLAKTMDNVVVLRTFSKMCALAALRLGFVCGHPGLLDGLRKVKTTFEVNGLAVHFAREIIKRPDIVAEMKTKVDRGRGWLTARLTAAGIEHESGSGNFVLIHCPKGAVAIVDALRDANILVSHGFRQKQLQNFIRINLGDIPFMEQFWTAFEKAYTLQAAS